MKSLKERLQQAHYIRCLDETMHDDIIQVVKEWLEEKKKQTPDLIEEGYWLIDDLIEELEQ